jgi:hypothetical protein
MEKFVLASIFARTHLVMQVQADDAIKAITEGNRQKTVDLLRRRTLRSPTSRRPPTAR